MKLALISSAIYPSATANRVHILAMADAFAKKGLHVDFLCRDIKNRKFSEGVRLFPLGTNRSITSAWVYAGFLRKRTYDFWFVREPHLLFLTILFYIVRAYKLPPVIVYEIHDMPRDLLDVLALSLLKKIKRFQTIVITQSLAIDLQIKYQIPKEKTLILPDGVNLDYFNRNVSKEKARISLGFGEIPLVIYSGSLFPWKGVYTVIEAARKTPQVEYCFLGGYDTDIKSLRDASQDLPNVKILGHVPHELIGEYLAAADVLVLPNSAKYKMSEKYTSPLKLFEYMASGRPIVASDLTSVREILVNGHNAYLIKPDDAIDLAQTITKVLSDSKSVLIAEQAFRDVQKYTWDIRAEKIINTVIK